MPLNTETIDNFTHKNTYPILILNNILSYGSQGGPFTVVGGSDSTAFMGFEFAH